MKLPALSLLLALSVPAMGFKSGAPESACESMIPEHHSEIKTTPSPYTIKLSKKSIADGGTVEVNILGTEEHKIRGFFVQARVGDVPVGKFFKSKGIKLVNCGGGVENAASHSENADKDKVKLTWQAPKGLNEKVRFRLTVVKTGADYWVGQESETLTVQ